MSDSIQVMDSLVRIAADVPPYSVMTVKLKMSRRQELQYQMIYKSLVINLTTGGGGVNRESDEGHLDMCTHCLLVHTTLNLKLHKFFTKKSKMSGYDIAQYFDKGRDYEAMFYHLKTKSDSHTLPYLDRYSMALYMSANSPKLQFLAGKAHNICLVQEIKLIVFCNWPMTLWMAAVFLLDLSLNVVDLWSVHTLAQHNAMVARFNDSADSSQVLMTSL